jgi:hypothetical protein
MRPEHTSAILIALLMAGRALAQSADLPADIELTLGAAEQTRIGLVSARLDATQAPEVAQGIGRVLDIGPLALLEAEIDSASAAAEASASGARRIEVLAADDQNASYQSLEAAHAQERADATRLDLARRRVALEWGTGLARLGNAERQRLVDAIVAGEAALLRVDPLRSGPVIDGLARLQLAAGLPMTATEPLGMAAGADPRTQTTGLLVLLRGEYASMLRAGRVVAAEIDTGKQLSGVVLPRDALIRADGSTWAYLRRGPERFLRREVLDPRLLDSGWFVSTGFAAGDEVVVNGSGSLFAIERSDEAIEAN